MSEFCDRVPSFGLLTLALWCYVVARLRPGLKLLKTSEGESFNHVPYGV